MERTRRELLSSGAVALAVASIPMSVRAETNPMQGWVETPLSKALAAEVKTKQDAVKERRSVLALTADEWREHANTVTQFGNVHGVLGNLHRIDAWAADNKDYIKGKLGGDPAKLQDFQNFLEKGSHYTIGNYIKGAAAVATKLEASLRVNGGIIVEAQGCFWDEWALMLGFIALVMGASQEGQAGAAPLAGLGLIMGFIGLFLCND